MKRSNRLVLLVGVFLAIVAFVGIILLSQRRRSRTADHAADHRAGRRRHGGHPAVDADPGGPGQDRARIDLTAIRAGRLHGPVAGHRQDRPPAGRAGRARSRRRPSSGGASGTIIDIQTPRRPCARSPSRSTRSRGVGTVIKTGDYVDMVIGFTGRQVPGHHGQPGRRLDHRRQRHQQHERQAPPPGHAGPRHAAPAGRRRRPRTAATPAPPAAVGSPTRPSTASSRS